MLMKGVGFSPSMTKMSDKDKPDVQATVWMLIRHLQSLLSPMQSPFLPRCACTFSQVTTLLMKWTWALAELSSLGCAAFPSLTSYLSNYIKNWPKRALWKHLVYLTPLFLFSSFFVSTEQSIFSFRFFLQGLRTSCNHYLYTNSLVSTGNCFIQVSTVCLCLKLASSIS